MSCVPKKKQQKKSDNTDPAISDSDDWNVHRMDYW